MPEPAPARASSASNGTDKKKRRRFPGGVLLSLANALVLHPEHFGERIRRQWFSKEEPLHLGASAVEQVGELLFRLHSFSYDAHVEALSHGDHCLHDRRIVLSANHVLHEHRSDL